MIYLETALIKINTIYDYLNIKYIPESKQAILSFGKNTLMENGN